MFLAFWISAIASSGLPEFVFYFVELHPAERQLKSQEIDNLAAERHHICQTEKFKRKGKGSTNKLTCPRTTA
jgi:hypothetical protein